MAMIAALAILLVLSGFCPGVHSASVNVTFTFQSKYNEFAEFINMYTLCLAPLATHVAFGLAKRVVLANKGPRWTDRLTEFNPISITWRYYAIAYRRLRAKQWDAADMAACNAHFWDGERWDGSEYMMIKSRDYLTNCPESAHTPFLSGSTLATGALVFQGIQALYLMVTSATVADRESYTPAFSASLPTLFVYLGLLGVIRLPAAFWISNEFGYTFQGDHPPLLHISDATESELDDWRYTAKQRLLDTRDWKCVCYRIWWIASIGAMMSLGLFDTISAFFAPDTEVVNMSITWLLFLLMFMQLCAEMLVIHVVYVFKHEHVSTVIPCSGSLWYKALTLLMMATAVAAVIAASLETVRLPDGEYTSNPLLSCNDVGICGPLNKTRYIEYLEDQWLTFLGDYDVK